MNIASGTKKILLGIFITTLSLSVGHAQETSPKKETVSKLSILTVPQQNIFKKAALPLGACLASLALVLRARARAA